MNVVALLHSEQRLATYRLVSWMQPLDMGLWWFLAAIALSQCHCGEKQWLWEVSLCHCREKQWLLDLSLQCCG